MLLNDDRPPSIFCHYIKNTLKDDYFQLILQIRVWSTPHTINQSTFALIGGVNVTEYYESFFSVPFPLPKQGIDLRLVLLVIFIYIFG